MNRNRNFFLLLVFALLLIIAHFNYNILGRKEDVIKITCEWCGLVTQCGYRCKCPIQAYKLHPESLKKYRKGKYTLIFMGRHGTTGSNRAGVSHEDGSNESIEVGDDKQHIFFLSELGKNPLLSGIYSGNNFRTITTSKIVEVGGNHRVISVPDTKFNEQDFGKLKGKTHTEFFSDDEFSKMAFLKTYRMSHGGESMVDVVRRALHRAIELSKKNEGKAIYICTSRGTIAAIKKFVQGNEHVAKSDLRKIYNIKNYHILVIKYYSDSDMIELVFPETISPEVAAKFLWEELLNEKASGILELAKKKRCR